eukprot:TRINITY_DN3059_c0_g1_i1.p1 TRINITY_DN3059_c0_g1~~TRINITY_DN3059_c0_g1_i1.p1  ORF type:complete len:200 (-),score=51.80 TRINITY_DN3059_c0_g1_i1:79-645(-)
MEKAVIVAVVVLVAAAYGQPAACPNSCPTAGQLCWDTSVTTGDCTETGPVYTEFHAATNCTAGCWKMISMIYEGTLARSGGNHNIFAQMLDASGNYIVSYPSGPYWTGFWGSAWNKHDGETPNLEVKGKDWGDYPVWASSWFPDTCKCPGPYGAFAGNVMANSDVLYGAGMPVNAHVNWRVIWKWSTN